jgi:hypothetical protein
METDGYDVRAVEARLAHMEATRRARSTVSMRPAIQPPQRPVVVGDFELRAMDSSDSDSEDASDNDPARMAKPRLRDSLDLSMSVSAAMPAAPTASRKAPLVKPKQHDTREKEPVAAVARPSTEPRVSAPTSLPESGRKAERSDDGLFNGKLVQRRRELEKQAAQQQRDLATTQTQHTLAPVETKQVPPTLVVPATGRGELKPPTPVRNDLQAAKTHEPTLPSRKDDSDTHRASGAEKLRELAARRAIVRGVEVAVDPPQKKPNAAVENKRGLVPPTVDATATALRQQSTQQIPRQHSTTCQDLPPKAPHLNPPASIKPIAATASTTVVSAVTVVAGTSKLPGYSRPHGTTNQSPVVVVATPFAKNVPSPINREPEDPATDDVIDDLLTAEEARLRESLDKLSQRLTSIAAVRATTAPRSATPSNQANVPDSTETKETKTLRSASYGGGAHSRLHQPTSPTARASHARRSELSGGVHKARVRIGGVTAQEASRADTMTDGGKHKITVKRDLAHLLF